MKQFILMADIIESGAKKAIPLMRHFDHLTAAANKKFKKKIVSPLTITLGDEFQGIITDLTAAIDIIFYMEEEMIRQPAGFKLRYVLMQGSIETAINTRNAYKMLGAGLTSAREKLNSLKQSSGRFFFSLTNNKTSALLNHAFSVIQTLIDAWNPAKDFNLIATFILYKDYKIVAEQLGKTRSQIWKREKTLNIKSYLTMKEIIYLSIK